MGRYRNHSSSANNGLLMRLLGYALTKFIIPFVILIMRAIAYAIITFIIPFVINLIKTKLGDQQRLLCTKCHRKLEVIDKGNLYCRNCKIIKFDPY
ncbi:MAG TPA: hypothetical protein VK250_08480 [Nitrososphaeraceae archaeon]|nr:hypothetical protein [Nitrososphaeraceae archaeon]